MHAKDQNLIQLFSLSEDPATRDMAYAAADEIEGVSENGSRFQSMIDDPDPTIQKALKDIWEGIPHGSRRNFEQKLTRIVALLAERALEPALQAQ
jgi:hypothetical protein